MWIISEIALWYRYGSNASQRMVDERVTRNEELNIWRRVVLDLDIQDPAKRDRLIEAAQLAAIGIIRPEGVRQRNGQAAILGAGLLTLAGGVLLLWLLNGGLALSWVEPSGALRVPLVAQAEIIVTLTAVGTLWATRNEIVEIFRHEARSRPESEKTFDFPLVVCAILMGVSTVGLPWVVLFVIPRYEDWPIGWQVLIGGSFVLGLATRRWVTTLWELLDRRMGRVGEETVDQVVWRLHYLAWLLRVHRPQYLYPRTLKAIRTTINHSARVIELNPVPLRAANWTERSLRRRIRHDHARVAATLREIGEEVAMIHTREQYDQLCVRVLAGAISAARGDWDELLENATEVTLVSRSARAVRRFAPSMVIAGAALVIPALPGVGASADGVRVLLLATAVLSILPTGDAARDIIRGTLDKALTRDSGSGTTKAS